MDNAGFEWRSEARCPCCFKKTRTVLGLWLNETPPDWCNRMGRELAEILACKGTCPWCGRGTTIVSKILLRRFEPMLKGFVREYGS